MLGQSASNRSLIGFFFLIRCEGKVADIERRAQDTCLCPGILEGLLGPSNNYVHGSITIDSKGGGAVTELWQQLLSP